MYALPRRSQHYNTTRCYPNFSKRLSSQSSQLPIPPCRIPILALLSAPALIAAGRSRARNTKYQSLSELPHSLWLTETHPQTRHMLTHESYKPYVCDHPDCMSRFVHNDELQRHQLLTHSSAGSRYEVTTCQLASVRHIHEYTGCACRNRPGRLQWPRPETVKPVCIFIQSPQMCPSAPAPLRTYTEAPSAARHIPPGVAIALRMEIPAGAQEHTCPHCPRHPRTTTLRRPTRGSCLRQHRAAARR